MAANPVLRTRPDLDPVTEISPEDEMHKGPTEAYFRFGLAGLRCVELALHAAGAPAPTTILDLPSGHGRVLRMLRAAYPNARITACDLNRPAVDWCAEHLEAIPVYSEIDPSSLRFDHEFDLIWCGSLLTHLNDDRWHAFLDLFSRSLAPGGVLVFTTAGRLIADEARSGKRAFPVVDINRLVAAYDQTGFGYEDYRDGDGYGIALASPAWVCEQLEVHPSLRLLLYTERGWNNRQDAVACVLAPEPQETP